jgi:hypothetical protein
MTEYKSLKEQVGKVLTLRGEITGIMWQHYIGSYEGYPFTNYVDLEDNPQIVIYSKEPINHKGKIEVTGEIVQVGHEATDENVKIQEEYWEYHMLVDTWKSLE